jgi:hypothetical protein
MYARARHERRWISDGPTSRTTAVWLGVMYPTCERKP